jgi:hypothetical protein
MEELLKDQQALVKHKQLKILQRLLLASVLSSIAQMVLIIKQWESSSRVWQHQEHGAALMNSTE